NPYLNSPFDTRGAETHERPMLNAAFIRENPEAVRKAIAEKNVSLDLDALLALDGEVRAMKTEIDELRRQRNEISDSFKTADPPALGARAKEMGARASTLDAALGEKEEALKALMLLLPGIPWEGAPIGPDETYNVVVRQEGKPPSFDFEPRDHVTLAEMNGWA